MATIKEEVLAREVIALRGMLTRSYPRRLDIEQAMGLAMTRKMSRLFDLADAVLVELEKDK